MKIQALPLAVGTLPLAVWMLWPPRAAPTPATLLVAAAASLHPVWPAVVSLCETTQPGLKIRSTLAASGALQRQIEQGAPIDVFVSAAAQPMQRLEEQGLLEPGTRQNLLTNRLVLIAPKSAAVAFTSFLQLGQPAIRRLAIGEPRSVPVGQYAAEVLRNLGLWESLAAKLVYGQNVRAVLTAVATGHADAGIVYLTDAKSSPQVTVVAMAPARLHPPIVYPVAVVRGSRSLAAARKFIACLQSPPAKAQFARYGFGFPVP
ncbi:MAG: molybdate ABC transporter substrate-binding protein [Oscillatoriales cyanobacterium SM2_1_8]|nr:molybdate ABC transporter substrate-binding protein [Oscillatoriales cyanobacterium SM2_1_8]